MLQEGRRKLLDLLLKWPAVKIAELEQQLYVLETSAQVLQEKQKVDKCRMIHNQAFLWLASHWLCVLASHLGTAQ